VGGWYLDTSAAVKLIVREQHSVALRDWVVQGDARLVGSELTRVELMRVARRRDAAVVRRALELLEKIDLVPIPATLFREAAAIDPAELRTLDALHLAVAVDLGDGIEGLITYDARLATAAGSHGLRVAAPRA
jgi:predicted nucleic acid-binding protein